MVFSLRNISKSYDHRLIFSHVQLNFEQCGMYFIKGESGSGKTTLLSIIGGIEDFNSGERYVDQEYSIAFIFQNFELIDTLSVRDNIYLYQDLYQCLDDDQFIIEELGLTDLLSHYPYELSYGQRQRVAIARALLQSPDVILCDEPTESLDKKNKIIVMNLLKKLSQKCIVIVASHDEELINNYYDYLYEIINYEVVLKKQSIKNKLMIANKKQYSLINKQLLKTMINMLYKHSIVYLSIFILICTFFFSMVHIHKNYFNNNSIGTLNDHVIYVTERKQGSHNHYLNQVSIRPKYNISPKIFINEKIVECSTASIPEKYPSLKMIQGNMNEIVINQFMADKLEEILHIQQNDIIGQKIYFQVNLGEGKSCLYEGQISGIVQEYEYLYVAQVYYHYQDITDFLKKENLDAYKYYIDNCLTYEFEYSQNTNMINQWNILQDDNNIMCVQQYLETLMFQNQQTDIIKLAFIAIITILIIVFIIFILFLTYQGYQKEVSHLKIIEMMKVPRKKIKIIYILIQMIIIIIGTLLSYILENIIYNPLTKLLDYFGIVIRHNSLLSFSIVMQTLMIVLCVYIVLQMVVMKRYDQKTISYILKE